MRDPAIIRLLPDGRRVHMHDGPIDLILAADGSPSAVSASYGAAAHRFVEILDELCAELRLLRSRWIANSPEPVGPIARSMAAAVSPFCDESFITPMAAVAGAVAEAVLAEMTRAARLDRAYVNNGGDIALHLSDGQQYTLGMIEVPDSIALFGSLRLTSNTIVRGVATSGWRGRSFSLGIADAVTVLAASAAEADAAATIIANAVDLPGHPAIRRVPANEILADSDLGEIPVTRHVDSLSHAEIKEALQNGIQMAEQLRQRQLIHSAALTIQGNIRVVAEESDSPVFESRVRSLHA